MHMKSSQFIHLQGRLKTVLKMLKIFGFHCNNGNFFVERKASESAFDFLIEALKLFKLLKTSIILFI